MNSVLDILLGIVVVCAVILFYYCKTTHKSFGEVYEQFKEFFEDKFTNAKDNIQINKKF